MTAPPTVGTRDGVGGVGGVCGSVVVGTARRTSHTTSEVCERENFMAAMHAPPQRLCLSGTYRGYSN